MTLEEKLKAKIWTTDGENHLIRVEDALSIIQQEIDEAVKNAKIEECKYWQDAIFSPQSIIAQFGVIDFQLRIAVLDNALPESPKENT